MASVMQLELQLPLQLMQQSLQLHTEQCLEMQAAVNCTTLNCSLKVSRLNENCIMLLTGHVADLVEIVSRKWRCIVTSVAHPDISNHDNNPSNNSLTILPHTEYTTLASITPIPLDDVKEEIETEGYSTQSHESEKSDGNNVTKPSKTSPQAEAVVPSKESPGMNTRAKRMLWTPEKPSKTSNNSPSPHKVHCVVCQKVFKCLQALQSHLMKVHRKKWTDYLMEIDSAEVSDLAMGLDFDFLMSNGIIVGTTAQDKVVTKAVKKSPKSKGLLACGECKERFVNESALFAHIEEMHTVRAGALCGEDVQRTEQPNVQRVDVQREEQPVRRCGSEESSHSHESFENIAIENPPDQSPLIQRFESQSASILNMDTSVETPSNAISHMDKSPESISGSPCLSNSSTNSSHEIQREQQSFDDPPMECSDLEDSSNDLQNSDENDINICAQEPERSGALEDENNTMSVSSQGEHSLISNTVLSETLQTDSSKPSDTQGQKTDVMCKEKKNCESNCCSQCGQKFKTKRALICHLRLWCDKKTETNNKRHQRKETSSIPSQNESEETMQVTETAPGVEKNEINCKDKTISEDVDISEAHREESDSQDPTEGHDPNVKDKSNSQSGQRSNSSGFAEEQPEDTENGKDPLYTNRRLGAGRRKFSKAYDPEDLCDNNVQRMLRKRKLDTSSGRRGLTRRCVKARKLPEEKKKKKPKKKRNNQSNIPEEKKTRRKEAHDEVTDEEVETSNDVELQDCKEDSGQMNSNGDNDTLSGVESLDSNHIGPNNIESCDDNVASPSSEEVQESEMNDDCVTNGSSLATESKELPRQPGKRGKTKCQLREPLKCCKCPRETKSVNDMRAHMTRMHKSCMSEHEIECFLEDQRTYGRHTLDDRAKMVCVFCKRERPGRAILNHLEVWHKDEETYSDVRKEFCARLKKLRILNPRNITLWGQKVKDGICCHCDKQFPSTDELKRHKAFECEKNKLRKVQQLECYMCDYKATDKSDLEVHRKSHTSTLQREWVCEICGKVYHYQGGLTTHRRVKHGIVGKQEDAQMEWQCDKCSQRFRYKAVYQRHLLTHSETMGATCDICGKSYKTARDLAVHRKRIHLNIYPYHCPKCGHGLQRKEWLVTHRCENVRPRQTRERGKKEKKQKTTSSPPKPQQTREDLLQKLMIDVNLLPAPTPMTRSEEPQQSKEPEPLPNQQGDPLTSVSDLDTTHFSLERARSLFQPPMLMQPPPLTHYNPLSFSPSVQPPMPLLSSFTEHPDVGSETESNAELVSECNRLKAKDVPWPDPSWLNEGD